MIGAFYYPWYGSSDWQFKTARGLLEEPQMPVLGWYDNVSSVDTFINHLVWADRYGIDFLSLSYSRNTLKTINRYFKHLIDNNIKTNVKLTFHIETLEYFDDNPIPYDGSSQSGDFVYRTLRNEFRYIIENYLSEYMLTLNGKPVIMLYVTRRIPTNVLFIFDKIREDIKNLFNVDIFIMADDVFWKESEFTDDEERLKYFDLSYCYNPYVSEDFFGNEQYVGKQYIDHVVDDLYKKNIWKEKFIPTVLPRYNDRGVRLGSNHYPIPHLDMEYFFDTVSDMYEKNGLLLITSFNEWYEDTQVEPCIGNASSAKNITLGQQMESYQMECLEDIAKFSNHNRIAKYDIGILPNVIKTDRVISLDVNNDIEEDQGSSLIKNISVYFGDFTYNVNDRFEVPFSIFDIYDNVKIDKNVLGVLANKTKLLHIYNDFGENYITINIKHRDNEFIFEVFVQNNYQDVFSFRDDVPSISVDYVPTIENGIITKVIIRFYDNIEKRYKKEYIIDKIYLKQ